MFYFEEILDEKLCMAYHDHIVVFGDNLIQKGKVGQAVIRDENNSFGIPTKRLPSMNSGSFFSDQQDEYDIVKDKLIYLWTQHEAGRSIILPINQVGTGLAKLEEYSPVIHSLITRFYKSAKAVNENTTIEPLDVDLNILSFISGFNVESFELSIDKSEIHYGSKSLSKDGFVTVKQYKQFIDSNSSRCAPQICENCKFYNPNTPNVCNPNGKEHDRWGIKVCSLFIISPKRHRPSGR